MDQRKLDELHARFLDLLPRIELHGHIYFRHLRSHRRADAVQEMVALAWLWYVRLINRGRDPRDFVATFVTLLARSVNSGRRLAGMTKAKDVMNPAAQKRHGFRVEPLPSTTRTFHDHLYASPRGQKLHDAFEERLIDNTVTPVVDQVQFRLDFPAWLETLTPRERRMIRAMIRNERTRELGKEFEVSPSRISQMRREFHDGWTRFIEETDTSLL
jgi:hypothetical protein